MGPEEWRRIKDLCQRALEHRPEERKAFLSQACPDDVVREKVETVLADATEDGDPESTLAKAIGILIGTNVVDSSEDDVGIPETFGPYRILERVGEGGMGVVYKAAQDRPHRVVALKVIRPSLSTGELLRRFERETDALARLQHPGIAQIYEVGAVDTGTGRVPYFAMEFIDGTPLRVYAESRRFGTRERLDLIARVCDAVEHAHQRGIIHRDLKPSNILLDHSGQPKILDFGVARITDSDGHVTRQTDVGQVIGTLAYMSPEQVLADPLELDTRSDVYALGVILYELLATRLPYRVSGTLLEAARTIQEEDPVRLSSIDRLYRGDVETIVAKALEKDKRRRYASAAALAADIRRYLKDEPIEARPATTAYQLRKFARRHKALVTSAAMVFVVLVVGIVVSAREAAKAREAEQTAQAVNDFLRNDLLAQASVAVQSRPNAKPDPDLKVRTALDRAAARIGGKFERQPAVEAAIRDTIGQTYSDLGIYAEARTQLERALELRRRAQGDANPETLRTTSQLGRVAFFQSKYPEAERLFRQAFGGQRRVLGLEHTDTIFSMTGLASVYDYEGKYTDAEALIREVLDVERRSLGPDNANVLRAMSVLQGIYYSQAKYAEAEALASEILAGDRRVFGPEHPDTMAAMNNLANAYMLQGKYAQAELLYADALAINRRNLGPENDRTLNTLQNLANTYGMEGKYAAASSLFEESLEIQQRVLGPEHSDTLHAVVNLADAYYLEGKYSEAELLFNRALSAFRRTLGPEHPRTLLTIADMANMYQLRGQYDRAEKAAADALAGRRHALGANHPATIASTEDLALAYLSQRKFEVSEPLARESVAFERKKQPDDWSRFRAESLLGASLAGQKKFAEAEPLLVQGYEGMFARKDRMGVPNWYYLDRAREWTIQLYQGWGKTTQAEAWRARLR